MSDSTTKTSSDTKVVKITFEFSDGTKRHTTTCIDAQNFEKNINQDAGMRMVRGGSRNYLPVNWTWE